MYGMAYMMKQFRRGGITEEMVRQGLADGGYDAFDIDILVRLAKQTTEYRDHHAGG